MTEVTLEQAHSFHNAYIVPCTVQSYAAPFGVCLSLHAAWRRGSSFSQSVAGCVRAFEAGKCPAQKLKTLDEEAGKPLHYVPPIASYASKELPPIEGMKSPKSNDAAYLRGWSCIERKAIAEAKRTETAPEPQKRPTRAPSAPAAKSEGIETFDVSGVVTLMAKEATVPVITPQAEIVVPIKPKPVVASAPIDVAPVTAPVKETPLMALARKMLEKKNGG